MTMIRTVYASLMLTPELLSAQGDLAGATKVYEDFSAIIPHHPLIQRALADLKTNQALDPLVHNAKEGAAEALYGLGSAGSRQGDELPALVYLRLSLYLRPSSDLTAVTLASLFEQLKQSDQAIAAYRLVPSSSPLKMGADIQIALELDGMGKTDEAMRRLTEIVAERPHDVEALSALAELQRSAKKYAEAAATYDRAIAAVGIPQRDNWTLFYFRGICYERSKQWPKAEADFKKALGTLPGSTARPKLSWLFLGRPRAQFGRSVQNAAQGRGAAAKRRLYRR